MFCKKKVDLGIRKELLGTVELLVSRQLPEGAQKTVFGEEELVSRNELKGTSELLSGGLFHFTM